MALLDLHDALFDEFREGAADGLQLETEVAADFLARHAQDQFGLREAARMQPLHQVQQERGQPLLGTHAAEQQHHAVLAHDFAAHDLVHVSLQGMDLVGQILDAVERHHADFRVLQCDRIAGVHVVDDPVEAHDFSSHLEAGDLVTAVLGGDAGLEEAGADRIQAGEPVAIAEQRCAALDLAPVGHQVIDAVEFVRAQSQGHAQFAQVATGAGHLDRLAGDRHDGGDMPVQGILVQTGCGQCVGACVEHDHS